MEKNMDYPKNRSGSKHGRSGKDNDKKDKDKEFEHSTPHVHEDEEADFQPGGMQDEPYMGNKTEKPDPTRTNPL